mmetsp:Transcript_21451/g.47585  ORF Transcript_21451/g.47585 Transcript_21451/m.47585 type:complete len:81 (+) Transcript_21451:467-709(+)
MVGFDCRLHGDLSQDRGKRFHMRQIASHYSVPFSKMVLFDDAKQNLVNEDGWHGVLVRDPSKGFCFSDCLGSEAGAPSRS